MKRWGFAGSALLLFLTPAMAQQVPVVGDMLAQANGTSSGRIVQYVVLLTVLSVAPSLLVMVTSFTRLIVAFSFLRSSLGMQSTPANLVITSLSLFLTYFVMAPTFEKAWNGGLNPLIENKITEAEAYSRITEPFRQFMLKNVREKDLALFESLATTSHFQTPGIEPKASGTDAKEPVIELRILVPAFMISELRRGFEIGFLIALPFLIIDLVVATITMAMGMMMMPPTVISLPFKILFFVLIDGWNMLAGSLVRSFS